MSAIKRPVDIPYDIWDIAYKAWTHGPDTVEAIARIVLAEREACIQTVDTLTSEDLSDDFIGRPASFGDALELAVGALRKRGTTDPLNR